MRYISKGIFKVRNMILIHRFLTPVVSENVQILYYEFVTKE